MAEYHYVTDAERVLLADRVLGGATPSPLMLGALEDILRARIEHAVAVALHGAREVVERQTDLTELVVFERPSDFRKGVLTSLTALDAYIARRTYSPGRSEGGDPS